MTGKLIADALGFSAFLAACWLLEALTYNLIWSH